MDIADEYGKQTPAFEQPDGVASFGEEQTVPLEGVGPEADFRTGDSPFSSSSAAESTLPLVDLYPTADSWSESSPYAPGQDYWNTASAPTPQPGAGDTAAYNPGTQPMPQAGGHMQLHTQQPNPYMQQQGPYGPQGQYMMVRPEHPNATTVLVLGAVSIAVPVLSFVAWYMGSKAKGEIERGAPFAYTGNLKAGHIIGKVMGILTIVVGSLYVVFLIGYLILILGLLSA